MEYRIVSCGFAVPADKNRLTVLLMAVTGVTTLAVRARVFVYVVKRRALSLSVDVTHRELLLC